MIRNIIWLGAACALVAFGNQDTQSSQNGTHNQSGQSGQSDHTGRSGQSARRSTEMQNPKAKQVRELLEMLHATDKARKAIAQHNQQLAAKDLHEALSFSNEAGTQHATNNLVPLYSELDRTSVLGPIVRQQKSTGSSQSGSADRSAPGSSSAQKNGSSNQVGVDEVVGAYTAVWLDVPNAHKHLQAAQQALTQNDLTGADRELQAVQGSLVVDSVATDMPLVRARENLMLARDSAAANHYREAQAQLREASKALSTYAKSSTSHSQDAQRLQSDIDTYAQSMTTNHADAASKIESWWDQTTNWISPSRGH
jgi:hypothetical protein